MKYTKDQLIQEFLEQGKTMTKYMERIDGTLKTLNDENRLHRQAVADNNNVTKNALETMNKVAESNDKFVKLFGVVMMILIGALVILAGAEKAIKFGGLI